MVTGSSPARNYTDPPPSVGFLVSRLGFSVNLALAQGLKPLGIDPQHFGLLRAMLLTEGQSQRAIGDSFGIPANRMVVLVDDLEARGAVKRAKHPSDRRAHSLSMTSKGRKLFEQAVQVAISVEQRLCEGVSDADKEQLLQLLGKLQNLSEAPAGVHPGLTV